MTLLSKTTLVAALGLSLTACAIPGFSAPAPAPSPVAQETATNPAASPETMAKSYSLEEVAEHNSKADCWLVIQGKVLDVTGFETKHPGGEAILQGCGKDATELFETRPMGSQTPHSDKARQSMTRFEIGTLAQ